MKLYIIGIGPGTEDYLLPIARRKIEEAECLIGAKRHLNLFKYLKTVGTEQCSVPTKEEILIEGHFDEAISYIKKHKDKKKIAVLVSGDPGMYSLLGRICEVLRPQEYAVIPGISAVQLAFARIGQNWSDARIVSLHGREINDLAGEIRIHSKVFLFTDAKLHPERIAEHLLREGIKNRRAVVFEKLGYPDESIVDTDLKKLAKTKMLKVGRGDFQRLCVMILL